MPLCGGTKTVQRKLVLLEPTVFENYVHDIFIDNVHVELSLWDTAGQEEFDRLRSLSYDDTHAIMLCFSVDSPESLENVESKWVGEIAENCPGVRLVLVALKCDLREKHGDEDGEDGVVHEPKRPMIDYKQGLAVAEKIKALRYLGVLNHVHPADTRRIPMLTLHLCAECSAMKNRGVNEAFTEAARVALQVKNVKGDKQGGCCSMM
ncbi:Rho GTPase [Friedmanniomyces endolithicus]|uniref:Rho GTPase n=1 Tax=Friedmanniomyces endolithicus TaxID=329885 RepID=A0AAN6FEF7_9PEZI|nr:Rho GTPase [Friedmanniomyces endolithicus]KAK0315084.1 Rho GTPase [Friedmanniomyces endolithicus]KAK0908705.1 Rho GTPase [Friedmanniomyces endolithicus]KAK1005512.1 Rho GTPase [Friedmanniomyces endolithicus]